MPMPRFPLNLSDLQNSMAAPRGAAAVSPDASHPELDGKAVSKDSLAQSVHENAMSLYQQTYKQGNVFDEVGTDSSKTTVDFLRSYNDGAPLVGDAFEAQDFDAHPSWQPGSQRYSPACDIKETDIQLVIPRPRIFEADTAVESDHGERTPRWASQMSPQPSSFHVESQVHRSTRNSDLQGVKTHEIAARMAAVMEKDQDAKHRINVWEDDSDDQCDTLSGFFQGGPGLQRQYNDSVPLQITFRESHLKQHRGTGQCVQWQSLESEAWMQKTCSPGNFLDSGL